MPNKPKILCSVTLYNCESYITKVLSQLEVNNSFFDEIIVVDNCSNDNSIDVAIKFISQKKIKKISLYQNNQNYGLGGSHKMIFNYARHNNFDYVVIFHGDNQGRIKDLLPHLKEQTYINYAALLGSRFMNGSSIKGYSNFRIFGNYIFNFIYSFVLRIKISDMGSGLNMYKVKELPVNFMAMPDDLTFNNAFLINLIACEKKINFFPISWYEDGQISNARLINQSLKLLKYAILFLFFQKKYKRFNHSYNNFSYKFKLIFKL